MGRKLGEKTKFMRVPESVYDQVKKIVDDHRNINKQEKEYPSADIDMLKNKIAAMPQLTSGDIKLIDKLSTVEQRKLKRLKDNLNNAL